MLKPSAKAQLESSRRTKTPGYYLSTLDPHVAQSFTAQQLEAVTEVLKRAITQPAPKIVDLRLTVDLIFSRFYLVIFVGKDRRQKQRDYSQSRLSKAGNLVAAIALLVGANLVISAAIVLVTYLIKSALGINLFPDQHITEVIQKYF